MKLKPKKFSRAFGGKMVVITTKHLVGHQRRKVVIWIGAMKVAYERSRAQ